MLNISTQLLISCEKKLKESFSSKTSNQKLHWNINSKSTKHCEKKKPRFYSQLENAENREINFTSKLILY